MAQLIAHRGQSRTFPENTLESIQAALDCGAGAVEFDLQLTADRVPVLCHDRTLARTAGVDIDVTASRFADLKAYSVGEPGRFGDRFRAVSLAGLEEVAARLQACPRVEVFAEIKNESLEVFGRETVAGIVAGQLSSLGERCVVIADDPDLLSLVRARHGFRIGWILRGWSRKLLASAAGYAPDFVIVNQRRLAGRGHDFPADPWAWILYETCDPARARALFDKGVSHVETNDICTMLQLV